MKTVAECVSWMAIAALLFGGYVDDKCLSMLNERVKALEADKVKWHSYITDETGSGGTYNKGYQFGQTNFFKGELPIQLKGAVATGCLAVPKTHSRQDVDGNYYIRVKPSGGPALFVQDNENINWKPTVLKTVPANERLSWGMK